MCSIFGCLNYNNNILSLEKFKQVNKLMYRRGPDHSDIKEYFMDNRVLRFGHNRLSILDLSSNGNQPMVSSCKKFSIIYNGEIYNHLDLRKEHCFLNHKWVGTSDTETLLSLFQFYNIETILNKLEGMFAFCVFDNHQKKIILARDRSGEKPLYISSNNNFFSFSSDLISLMQLPNFEKKISRNALHHFIMYNYISNPNSIFESTYKLPPSSLLILDLKKYNFKKLNSFNEFINEKGILFKKWWNINEKFKINFDKNNYYNKTEEILSKSIKNRLISDVPLGAFLSGGIDSSLTVALMQKLQNQTKTFTIGYENKNYDESKFSQNISEYLNTDHTSYTFSKNDFLEVIVKVHDVYSEPFADSSQIPTMLLSKIARKNVKVVLTGDGGDELFGGYNRYLYANKYFKYIQIFSNFYGVNFFKLLNFIPIKIFSILIQILTYVSKSEKINNNKLEKIFNKLKHINSKKTFYNSLTREWPENSNIFNNNYKNFKDSKFDNLFEKKFNIEDSMMLADFQSYLTDDILCKVDRASMYSSLETRTPFLSHELIEYSQTIPLSYKINNGITKIILKKILSKYLPEKFFMRPKAGFAIPISDWMRNDLKNWVNDILSPEICNKHNYFNFQIIQQLKDEHFKGISNHEHKLWSLIQFNNWYLTHID